MSTIRQLSMFRRYRLILGDPPWDFRNWSADAPGMLHNRARGANKWYPTLTLDQIVLSSSCSRITRTWSTPARACGH